MKKFNEEKIFIFRLTFKFLKFFSKRNYHFYKKYNFNLTRMFLKRNEYQTDNEKITSNWKGKT